MTAKNFLNRASWIILVFLFLPAGAVLASQNAIPGEAMYPVKMVLEDAVLLAMKPSNSATSDMEIKFTKRRLLEVEQIEDPAFVIKSLTSLNDQVIETTDSIEKVKDSDKQSELAREYIQTLRSTQSSLEKQKTRRSNQVAVVNSQPSQVVNNYYYTQNVDSGQDEEFQRQIRQTQVEIEAEIARLERVAADNARIKQQQELEKQRLEEERQRQDEVNKIQQRNDETVRQNQEIIKTQQEAFDKARAEQNNQPQGQQEHPQDQGNNQNHDNLDGGEEVNDQEDD